MTDTPRDQRSWRGRVVVVTGASRGLGSAIAERIIERGGSVATVARAPAKSHGPTSDRAFAAIGDLTRPAAAGSVIRGVIERFGRIDALVNNLGGGDMDSWDVPDEQWRRMIDLNLMSAVRMCRAAVPHLRSGDNPRIVNVSTELTYMPDEELVPYTAAKAALMSFSKSLSRALAPDGILVNVLAPGTIATRSVEDYYRTVAENSGVSFERVLAQFVEQRRRIALGRMGDPEEIADMAVFLASKELRYATGSVFRCDGGSTPSPW